MSEYMSPKYTTVAKVYDKDDCLYDEAWTWETGQTYANDGYRVVAVKDDGIMTIERAQAMYDAELAAALDCFGPGHRK